MISWYWHKEDDQEPRGPVDDDTLRQMAQSGAIQIQDKVWREGLEEWIDASSVPGLFAIPSPILGDEKRPPKLATPVDSGQVSIDTPRHVEEKVDVSLPDETGAEVTPLSDEADRTISPEKHVESGTKSRQSNQQIQPARTEPATEEPTLKRRTARTMVTTGFVLTILNFLLVLGAGIGNLLSRLDFQRMAGLGPLEWRIPMSLAYLAGWLFTNILVVTSVGLGLVALKRGMYAGAKPLLWLCLAALLVSLFFLGYQQTILYMYGY